MMTYATLPKLFGIDGRGKVESPGVVRGRVFPIDEAFRGLANPCA